MIVLGVIKKNLAKVYSFDYELKLRYFYMIIRSW